MSQQHLRFILDQLRTNPNGEQGPPNHVRIERPIANASGDGTTMTPSDVSTHVEGAPGSVLDDVFGRTMLFAALDSIYVRADVGIDNPDLSAGFTLAGWVRAEPSPWPEPVFYLGNDSQGGWMAVCVGDHLEIRWPTNNGWTRIPIPVALVAHRWTHLTVVFDGRQLSVHVDGAIVYEDDVDPINPGTRVDVGIGGANALTPRLHIPWGGASFAVNHDGTTYAADVSADSSTTPPTPAHVALWDLATGARLRGPDGSLLSMARDHSMPSGSGPTRMTFSGPASERIVIFEGASMNAYDVTTGEQIEGVPGDTAELTVSGDGRRIARQFRYNILMHDGLTLEPVDAPRGYADDEHRAHDANQDLKKTWLSHDGSVMLVTAAESAHVYGAAPAAIPINQALMYVRRVTGADLSPDGRTVAVVWEANGAHLHDTSTGEELRDPEGASLRHDSDGRPSILDVSFVPGANDVLLLERGFLVRRTFMSGEGIAAYGPTDYRVECDDQAVSLDLFADINLVALRHDDGSLRLHHLDTGQTIEHSGHLTVDQFDPDGHESTRLSFTPISAGREVLIGTNTSALEVYDVGAITGRGFAGAVAELSLRDDTRTRDDIIADVKATLPEVRVGTIFPIDFAMHDGNQQQALYLQEVEQQLRIDISNVSDRAVRIPAGSPHEGAGTFEIWLRPGTLAPAGFDRTTVRVTGATGWTVTWQPGPFATDGSDVFVLSRNADADADQPGDLGRALAPGESLGLTLDGLIVNTSQDAHTTRVQLKFRLEHHDGSALAGSRLHHLRILPESDSKLHQKVTGLDADLRATEHRAATLAGRVDTLETQEKILRDMEETSEQLATNEFFHHGGPLAARTVGVGALRNDATTLNTLAVRIDDYVTGAATPFSTRVDHPPTFTLHLVGPVIAETDPPDSWLLTPADFKGSSLTVEPASVWKAKRVPNVAPGAWQITPVNDDPAFWPTHLSPLEAILTTTCRTTTGPGQLRITYNNIGTDAAADPTADATGIVPQRVPSPEGLLVVPVDRSPLIAVDNRRAIANGTIDITQTPRIGLRHGNEDLATAAIDLDAAGGLRMQSSGKITLRPSRPEADLANPPPAPAATTPTATAVVQTDVSVVGSLGVQGDIHAEGHDVVAMGATLAGDIELSATSQVHLGSVEGGSWLVPAGAIVMWWGSEGDVPTGWAICNGAGGLTPDMRSRFPVGASSGTTSLGHAGPPDKAPLSPRNLNSVGGEEKHKLLHDEGPTHDHSWNHLPQKHDHGMSEYIGQATTDEDDDSLKVWAPRGAKPRTTAEFITDTFVHEPSGKGTGHENMPPFRSLHFIMKLAPKATTP